MLELLEKLSGMDLPEDAKAVLTEVTTKATQLTETNKNFAQSIESKDNAIAEMTTQRTELKTTIAGLKDEVAKGGSDDSTAQIESINREWQEKYGTLEGKYDGLNSKVSDAARESSFASLNIASKFPKNWDEAQIAFATKAIQREVFENSTYDPEHSVWGYGEIGKMEFNTNEGKAYTIESKAREMMARGAFDMFLDGKQGSGGGTPPNSGSGGNVALTLTERLAAK